MNQCSQSFSQIATKKDLDSIPEFSRSDSIPPSKTQKQLNFHASSRLIHLVCMNRHLLSSSETVFFLGILVTISGLSLLSCSSSTRQSLAVSSKSDSFHALSKSETFSVALNLQFRLVQSSDVLLAADH
jgi:hypothetical protein